MTRLSHFLPFLLGGALLLAGCQPGEEGSSQPQSLEERAQARWDLMVERDFAAAWDYYTPGFREANTRDAFAEDMGGRPVRWLDAEVNGSSCDEENICTVEVRVTYQPTQGPSEHKGMKMTRVLKESWIRLDERWWYTTD